MRKISGYSKGFDEDRFVVLISYSKNRNAWKLSIKQFKTLLRLKSKVALHKLTANWEIKRWLFPFLYQSYYNCIFFPPPWTMAGQYGLKITWSFNFFTCKIRFLGVLFFSLSNIKKKWQMTENIQNILIRVLTPYSLNVSCMDFSKTIFLLELCNISKTCTCDNFYLRSRNNI